MYLLLDAVLWEIIGPVLWLGFYLGEKFSRSFPASLLIHFEMDKTIWSSDLFSVGFHSVFEKLFPEEELF